MSIIERQPAIAPGEQISLVCPQDYEFVLPEAALRDPNTNRGTVEGIVEVPPIDEYGRNLPEGVRVFNIGVKDPFIEADLGAYTAVRDYIAYIEGLSRAAGLDYMNRSEAMNEGERNPYTNAWLSDSKVQSLSVWRGLVPDAEALHYLTNPYVGRPIADKYGNTGVVSQETAAQIRFVEDAVGIRDRGVAMAHLLKGHFAASPSTHEDVLSLASGTAEPVLLAAREAIDETGKSVSLTVADRDSRALDLVAQNAQRVGLEDAVKTVRGNILGQRILGQLYNATGLNQWDVVENMGFQEYLPQDGDEMGALKGAGLPQASDFTRTAFSLVKPGGVLVSGNMVLERPQRDFVFGIVDWPLINARSERSILRVYEQAGILHNPDVQIDMFRIINTQSGTHIYNIVRATKLA